MNIREEFLKSVEEESAETFLRFMEQHVSNVFMRSLMKKRTLTYVNLFVVSGQLACLCIHDMKCAFHELLIIYV